MMDPRRYKELTEQEACFLKKYHFNVVTKHKTAPDTIRFTDNEIHVIALTVTGSCYIFRESPVFRSHDNGAFYRKFDALVNAHTNFVDWLKEMDAKGYMSYVDESSYVVEGHVDGGHRFEILSQDQEYADWLSNARTAFEQSQMLSTTISL